MSEIKASGRLIPSGGPEGKSILCLSAGFWWSPATLGIPGL